MKHIITSCLLILWSVSMLSQPKVLERSSKKQPTWTTQLERGFIVGIGKGTDVQTAQDNAMLHIKSQIVSSVADNIVSSSSLKTVEITVDKIATQFESFSSTISSESAQQDFLKGISTTNVSDTYWEKIQDKSTKAISYQYYIKYPFSSFDLDKLVAEFKMRDRELTEELERTIERLDTFTSIEELRECKSILSGLHTYFIDQRKVKAQAGIDRAVQLLQSVIIRNAGSTLGTLRYALYVDNRVITFSGRPTIKTPCTVIEDKKFGTEICELKYRYDECYGDIDNTIVSIPNQPYIKRPKRIFSVASTGNPFSFFSRRLWEKFFPVYRCLQRRYFFERGSEPFVWFDTGLQTASQQGVEDTVILSPVVVAGE